MDGIGSGLKQWSVNTNTMRGYLQNIFIIGLNDYGMLNNVLKELATLANIEDAMSECVVVGT